MAEGHEFLEYLYLSCKGPAASERALAAGTAGEDIPLPAHNPHNPIQAGTAGEPTPFQQYSSHNLLRQAGKAGKAPATSKILPTTTKPAKPARSPLFQRNSSHIPAKPAKPARPPASYRQVTSKLNYEAKTPLQMRQLKIDHFSVELPASYQQVTSKLKYKPNPNYNYVN